MKSYCVTNIFDLRIFNIEAAVFLIFFEICTERHFVSLFFLNKKNLQPFFWWCIYYLIFNNLMVDFTIVHYANLNSRFINNRFLISGRWICYLFLFGFLIYVYFNEAFIKNFMKKLSLFIINFPKLFQDVVYSKILGCQTLWY